ncbi:MAG: ribosomal protein L7/L12 [Candidatus Binatia bacterium]
MDNDPLETPAAPTLPPSAIAALYKGNKIEGIKIVREERNIGLKEAKDAVEQYVAGQPSLQTALATAQSQGKRSVLLWLIATIALALYAYHWLRTP